MAIETNNGRWLCIVGLPVISDLPARILPAFVVCSLAWMAVGTAYAQTDAERIVDLESKLQKALTVIEKLSEKMDRLEKRMIASMPSKPSNTANKEVAANTPMAAPAAPIENKLNATVAAQNSRIDGLQQQVSQMSSATTKRLIPFDWLHGFVDVGAGVSTNGHPQGFGVGNLDLYITPNLGGKVRSLAELVFEYDRVGDLEIDLERAQIGYAFNDKALIWLGRFHTPYGYWQTAFHHGAQIQPSLLRPRFIEFEDKGGILPAHSTGAWATGKLQTAGGRINWDFYLSNSPRIVPDSAVANRLLPANILNPNVGGFSNLTLTTGGRIGYTITGGAFDSLNIGLHGLRTEVQILNDFADVPTAGSGRTVDLNMAGGYLYYNKHNWEVISEIYGFLNRDNNGPHNSWAGFVHLGYYLDQWMPYLRLEKLDSNKNDAYFRSMAYGYAYSRESLGLRYDLNAQSALKLETGYTQPAWDNIAPINNFWETHVQYAIRF